MTLKLHLSYYLILSYLYLFLYEQWIKWRHVGKRVAHSEKNQENYHLTLWFPPQLYTALKHLSAHCFGFF